MILDTCFVALYLRLMVMSHIKACLLIQCQLPIEDMVSGIKCIIIHQVKLFIMG